MHNWWLRCAKHEVTFFFNQWRLTLYVWRNERRIWFPEPYDNCTLRLKSSFLYGGSRHQQKLKNLKFEFFFSFWNSSVVQILQLCKVFTLSDCVLHWLYIYLSFQVLYSIHLLLILQVDFSAKWVWSDPSPSMLNSIQSVHKFFMCVLFETRSKSSLCPCQLKKLWTEFLTYII